MSSPPCPSSRQRVPAGVLPGPWASDHKGISLCWPRICPSASGSLTAVFGGVGVPRAARAAATPAVRCGPQPPHIGSTGRTSKLCHCQLRGRTFEILRLAVGSFLPAEASTTIALIVWPMPRVFRGLIPQPIRLPPAKALFLLLCFPAQCEPLFHYVELSVCCSVQRSNGRKESIG